MNLNYWDNCQSFTGITYKCGYCGATVGPDKGYRSTGRLNGIKIVSACIYICPSCSQPTYIEGNISQIPAPRFGENVNGITDVGVQSLYNEARDCTSVGSYTAAALLCRKILMNIAVQHGADEGKQFAFYIDFLVSKNLVTANMKPWVDIIRIKGNEATHEIDLTTKMDAEKILRFVEMLLRIIYEYPAMS